MKRDWEIIRTILLRVEDLESGNTLRPSDFGGTDSEVIAYHVFLLKDAGLIDASILEYSGSSCIHFDIHSLTWSGHEFLDSIRNNSIWKETKSKILSKSGAMTFEIIKSVAVEIAKAMVNS